MNPQAIYSELTEASKIKAVFSAQQDNRWAIAQTGVKERITKLKRLEQWVLDNRAKIKDALYSDFKKPGIEVDLTEVAVSLLEIRHTHRNLKRWLRPKRAKKTPIYLTAKAWTQFESRGTVLIIAPWNYSINLILVPLAAAIAAGNCVILKPSEFSPNSSRLIGSAIRELFPENEVAVFNGDEKVAIELLKHPFDHIFFTGSTETGKRVMTAAAQNLSSVTLELGGKSPVIIDNTANIKDAAYKIAWSKILNSGQSCHAPDYLLVHESVENDFIGHLKDSIKKLLGNEIPTWHKSDEYARVIDQRHYNRLINLLNDAVKGGAKIELGGEFIKSDNYISPTILSNVDLDADLMQEEIFGPLLPIISFSNIDDVPYIINSKPKPLALYIFSKNRRVVDNLLKNTSAGTTCINDVYIQYSQTNLPFGGVNHSGIGKAHGYYAFREFSNIRAVLKHHRFAPLKLVYPPYNRWTKRIADLIIKYL